MFSRYGGKIRKCLERINDYVVDLAGELCPICRRTVVLFIVVWLSLSSAELQPHSNDWPWFVPLRVAKTSQYLVYVKLSWHGLSYEFKR